MRFTCEVACFCQQDDGDNYTVDGDGLTEDDTDQILRFDTRHLDGTTQQRTACDEDTPIWESKEIRNNGRIRNTYQAAPMMESPRESATPM